MADPLPQTTARRLLLAALAAACLVGAGARAETIVQRDERGRRVGTIETRRDGSAVLRDERGRRTGTVERRGDDLIRRDERGRRTGSYELQPGGRR